MSPSGRRGVARVEFDELAWNEDIAAASAGARVVAEQERLRLEQDGQVVSDLKPCDSEGPHGTSLRGCVKAYLPPAGGPWGAVFRVAKRPGEPAYLVVIAFGLRHPPAKSRQPSVYERAHRRLYDR